MVQIRPGVAEYDLPRGEEQARVGWGYAARREGPADREQGEGIGRGARGSGSLGGTDCAEKRGAHLLIDLSSQSPSYAEELVCSWEYRKCSNCHTESCEMTVVSQFHRSW